jgi:hypothetical protein
LYTSKGPYGSWGNGGAMRVSPCGWLARTLEEAEALAGLTAGVTHKHPEGLRGAQSLEQSGLRGKMSPEPSCANPWLPAVGTSSTNRSKFSLNAMNSRQKRVTPFPSH